MSMLVDWNQMQNQSTARGPRDKSTLKFTGLKWITAKRIMFELSTYILNLTNDHGSRKRSSSNTESETTANKR